MSTAFQYVIDNATSISVNRRKKVSQTVSRDGTVKTLSLGGQLWEFQVTPPSGPKWADWRGIVEELEAADRVTVGQIQFNASGQSWIAGYQGNVADVDAVQVSYTSGNTVEISAGAATSGFNFKAGDLIQLGTSGSVYSVVSNVAFNSTTVTLNRPVRETAGTYTLNIGPDCVFNVICVEFPNWTLTPGQLISWDGNFVFAESI